MWLVALESSIQYCLYGLSEAFNPTKPSGSGERDVQKCMLVYPIP